MADRNNPDFLSASTIKGDKVVNAAGDNLGKIEELMIDLHDGRLAYAVMSFGGFLGMGDKLFAIPWQAFRLKLHDHAFVLDIPKETLEKAEGFDKDNWPITSREWLSTIYSYYGYQPYWQTGVAAGTVEETESQRIARTGRTSADRESPDFLSAGTLKGDKVVSTKREDIGKIEELMIDLQNGKVGYVVVSHGGFLGIGNKLFAVPWQAFTLRVHEHAFALNIPKETLEKSEGFDKDNWPLTREELSRTYSYYGYQPYWQAGVAAAGVSAAMPTETESERAARMEREKLAQPERERTETGKRVQTEGMAGRNNPDFLSSSTIKGDKVVNAAGDDLGKIEELMIDLRDGRLAYAVMSFGGFLGMGDKLFAIPWQAFRLKLHDHAFVLDIPKETLEKAEGFDKDNWPITSREWLSTVYGYYGYQPYWQTGVAGQTGISTRMPAGRESERMARMETERRTGMPGETESERMARMESTAGMPAGRESERMARMETERRTGMPGETESERMARMESTAGRDNPDFLSADTIKSDKIVNKAGEDIGKIEELMIDLQDGKVAYAVVSHGGLLGIGSKLFAIPWQALSLRVHEHAFVLDVPKETFEKAEGFDKDNWPLTREELSRTYSYYGYQPYWQAGAAAAGAAAAGVPRETEAERMARMERETREPTEVVEERVIPTETEEIRARQEIEKLEGLKETQEEKISQLEKQRMEAQRKAEAERDRLAQLERERIEAERQAQAERERLLQLEKELQEARRKEETEKVARLEEELMIVQTHEQTHKGKLSELEKACTEAQRQAGIERETLARLEQERIEAERLASTQRERLAQLERERMEAPTRVEAGLERAAPDFLSANTIKTDRVVNTAGEDLGRIEELMIDLENGRIAYAVLSFGGFLGMADKLFAIPWQALSPRLHEHAFVLDISKDVLERAEGFDKDHWPLTRGELSGTYTYYGYQPYWQREVEAGVPRETQPQRQRTTRTERTGSLDTAEEVMARQEKERIEKLEKTETDEEKRQQLDREKEVAERREHKYH